MPTTAPLNLVEVLNEEKIILKMENVNLEVTYKQAVFASLTDELTSVKELFFRFN